MTQHATDLERQAALRSLAHSKLTGSTGTASESSSAAFGVLYELASSPETASDALKLLHELQVHQIELDLQSEELRGSHMALEASLLRKSQLYDFAPVACCTVDERGILQELNLAGAALLRSGRDELLGRSLDDFLAPQGVPILHRMLARVRDGSAAERAAVAIVPRGGPERSVEVRVHPDPAGHAFLIALVNRLEDT